jgi:hypothetical protein
MKNRDKNNFNQLHLQQVVEKSVKTKKWAEVDTSARFNPYLMKIIVEFVCFVWSKNKIKEANTAPKKAFCRNYGKVE